MTRLKHFENLKGERGIRKLPPIDFCVLEHAKRVYYQCQNWSLNYQISPLDWG